MFVAVGVYVYVCVRLCVSGEEIIARSDLPCPPLQTSRGGERDKTRVDDHKEIQLLARRAAISGN